MIDIIITILLVVTVCSVCIYYLQKVFLERKNQKINENDSINLQDIYQKLDRAEYSADLLRSDIKGIFDSFTNPIHQGTQGEDILRLIFERSGLIEGQQFIYNQGVGNDGRPDFVVYLPGGGAVYVDAKFITNNFVQAYATENSSDRERLLESSAMDVENAAKGLAQRNYTNFEGYISPNMILMFLPNDNIYANAIQRRENLIDKCLMGFTAQQRTPVVLVTPSSVASSLKVISLMWRERNLYTDISTLKKSLNKLHKGLVFFNRHFVDGGAALLKASNSFRKSFNQYSSIVPQIKEIESKMNVVDIDFPNTEDFMHSKTLREVSEADLENVRNLSEDQSK